MDELNTNSIVNSFADELNASSIVDKLNSYSIVDSILDELNANSIMDELNTNMDVFQVNTKMVMAVLKAILVGVLNTIPAVWVY